MDFKLSEDHLQLQEMYRDFAENEVKPIAKEIDETMRFPRENVEKMAEMGLFGIPFSEEMGGAGMDNLSYVQCVEELSKCCASTGIIVSVHTSLCAAPIEKYGTDEQKEKYLKQLASGQMLGAFALTEPSAGTDASMAKTTAILDGDNYILNGSKIFITNAGQADVYVILAMTDKSQGTRGMSAFIVEKDFPGFSVGTHEMKMGIRASATCELVFDDCIVPKENLLGVEGKGFGLAMKTLDGGRIGVAAQALGIAEGAIEETVKYVNERVQFGRSISKFQNTQFELAKMRASTEAAKLLVYQAARAVDDGEKYSHLAAMAKLVASNNASDVTRRCLQLFGGYGFTSDYPIERMMRDAKITEIYEGTSEVQMMVIAGWMGVK
jgi:butyryl-CoA dehydrogenase